MNTFCACRVVKNYKNYIVQALSILMLVILFAAKSLPLLAQVSTVQPADPTTVQVVRDFGGELFRINSVPYLQPLVQLLNATANGRSFHTAFIGNAANGRHENTFYMRVGIYGMGAFVRPDQMTYAPQLPTAELDLTKLTSFVSGNLLTGQISIRDTAGLIGYAVRVLTGDGIREGRIQVPAQASSFFGNLQQNFTIPKTYFRDRLNQGIAGIRLSPAATATILQAIERLPDTYPLPNGQNLSLLPLAVPQVEIGSLYGTELMLRFIPSLDWGNNIGRFGFWGVGVKHSISQYIPMLPFELAAQGVVQGSRLTNTIGVTGAQLLAETTIFNANIHASKRFGIVEVFSGLSYDALNVNASYTFVLPLSLQIQLGLLKPVTENGVTNYVVDAAAGFPGDTQPQVARVNLANSTLRWTLGGAVHLGNVSIVADYNLSTFSMLTAGVNVRF
jgi:hypothetical protein